MLSLVGQVSKSISRFFDAVVILKWGLTPAILAFLMFSLPEQSHDVYRVYALDTFDHIRELFLTIATLLILTFALQHSLRHYSRQYMKSNPSSATEISPMLGVVSSIALAMPWLGIVVGLYRALPAKLGIQGIIEMDPSVIGYPVTALRIMGILTTLLAGLILVVANRGSEPKHIVDRPSIIDARRNRLLIYASIAVVSFLPLTDPVAVPLFFGPLAIVTVFCTTLTLTLLLLSYASLTFGFPIIPALLTFAFFIAAFDRNDNHQVRTVKSSRQSAYPRADSIDYLESEFLRWLMSRKDLEYYRANKKPYPIYVIAARGGGLYAAYHSALTLAHIQDHCPNFSQHVFAISGVSGGSLGATVFARLAGQFAQNSDFRPCNIADAGTATFQLRTQAILQNDFLSPLLWHGLFPDFVQAFLPIPVPLFDRARSLEASFEDAWADAVPEAPDAFKTPFFQSWTPEGVAPLLILNTTDVGTGERVAFMPFTSLFLQLHFASIIDHAGIPFSKNDFPTSAVVGLSARFPWDNAGRIDRRL